MSMLPLITGCTGWTKSFETKFLKKGLKNDSNPHSYNGHEIIDKLGQLC